MEDGRSNMNNSNSRSETIQVYLTLFRISIIPILFLGFLTGGIQRISAPFVVLFKSSPEEQITSPSRMYDECASHCTDNCSQLDRGCTNSQWADCVLICTG